MKILNIPQLMEDIQVLSEVEDLVEDSPQIEKYIRLLELVTEDYVSVEHLTVSAQEWNDLGGFVASMESNSGDPLNPHAVMIRRKLKNVTITHKLERGFMETRMLPAMSDDFI